FPQDWDFAEIELPEWRYAYKREQGNLSFHIHTQYQQAVQLKMEVPVSYAQIKSIKVNGQKVPWTIKESSINRPVLVFEAPAATTFQVQIEGEGALALLPVDPIVHPYTEELVLPLQQGVERIDVYDPQNILSSQDGEAFKLMQKAHKGTFFVKLRQGEMIWWQAVNIHLEEPIETEFVQRNQQHYLVLKNRTAKELTAHIGGTGIDREVELVASGSEEISLPASAVTMGTNTVEVRLGKHQWTA